jgi:MHS family shikimate/dehydroshikimate transporter-like MFS transporter
MTSGGRHRAGTGGGSPHMRRITVASLVGTTIEWYDFFLYGTMAALVFGKIFFPALDPTAATLASFATFTVGFFARPIGGLLMGHFGDKVGRKAALVTSLSIMGGVTFTIGLLPTYDNIGIWAPALLTGLRFLQGFALGGEWAGAAALTTEHAPAHRRGWYGSWVQYGALGGIFLSTGTVLLLSQTLTERQFMTWGWRVPFLLSGILLVVGLFIRLRIEESPVFQQLAREGAKVRVPVVAVLRSHSWTVVRVTGMHLIVTTLAFTSTTFLVSYGVKTAGFTRSEMLGAVCAGVGIAALFAPLLGLLVDRVGGKRMYVTGALLTMALIFPAFRLLETGEFGFGVLAVLCIMGPSTVMYTTQAAFFTGLFPAAYRVTGAGLGVQLATVALGGPAPLIAQSLLTRSGGESWSVAAYICGVALVSMIFALLTREPRPDRPLPPAPVPSVPEAAAAGARA